MLFQSSGRRGENQGESSGQRNLENSQSQGELTISIRMTGVGKINERRGADVQVFS